MNRKIALALAIASAASASAFADDGIYQPDPFTSTRTRAEVTRAYLETRDAVSALNGEDSGSVYLARREAPQAPSTQFAAVPDAGVEE